MARQKTIALVANTTWNIYNFRLNVIRKFTAEGYTIIVLSPVDEFIHYKKEFPEVTHIPIERLDRDGTNPIRDLSLVMEFIKKYKAVEPDIIIHYTIKPNIYGALAAKFCKIPSIAVVTGLGYSFLHAGFVKRMTHWLYKMTLRLHDKVIFESQDDRSLFIDLGLSTKEKSISIKGCGVNVNHYISKVPLRTDKTIFTYVGRLLYDKGIREFVGAAEIIKASHPDISFWLIGDIDDENPASIKKDDLLKWVKQGTVIYHGSTSDVREFIEQSSCIVLPSYREAIARSLTEAMSMKKAVIATNVAGCREAVDHNINGYLVPVRNKEALAAAMLKFIDLAYEDKTKMGLKGREKVLAEFDDRLIAENIYNLCNDMLSKVGQVNNEAILP